MRRDVFTPDHEAFREVVRDFLAKEIVPYVGEWEKAGHLPRDVFGKLGDLGLISTAIPEQYGGGGQDDYRYNVVLQEEAARALVTVGTLRTQLDVILPYFLTYTNEEQKRRWLPGIAAGRTLTAIAMTEPGTGSDLAGIRTTAVRDGDHYVLNGAKTFISNGQTGDLFIIAVRTAPDRHKGLSLLVVDPNTPGFSRGRNLEKIGLHAQDTSELSF